MKRSARRAAIATAMGALLAIAVGAFAGTALRYIISQCFALADFGWATLVVNLLASVVFGALIAFVRADSTVGNSQVNRQVKLIGGVGFCGTLSTYSSLVLYSVGLLRHGEYLTGIGYVFLSVVAGVLFAAVGYCLTEKFWERKQLVKNNSGPR